MKNVKNVSLNNVKGFKRVGNVNYYLGNLPRLNGEKLRFNREATFKQITRKRKAIDIPVDIEIITEKESFYIELNYKLERMQKIEGSRYDCSVREQKLDLLITLDFEDLRLKLGDAIKRQIENHMKNIKEMMKINDNLAKENDDLKNRYYNASEMLNKKSKENDALIEEKYSLIEKNTELKNEIVELKQRLNNREKDIQNKQLFGNKINELDLMKTVLPFLVKNIINMSKKGKTEMEILKKVEDYIERLKNIK